MKTSIVVCKLATPSALRAQAQNCNLLYHCVWQTRPISYFIPASLSSRECPLRGLICCALLLCYALAIYLKQTFCSCTQICRAIPSAQLSSLNPLIHKPCSSCSHASYWSHSLMHNKHQS